MRNWLAGILLVAALAIGVLWWRSRHAFEVYARGEDVHIDKINLAVPMLWQAIEQNPQAHTFCVEYRMVPDPVEPGVYLTRTIDYNRNTKVLRWSREFWYESYTPVTDEIIKRVALKNGGVRMFLRLGCMRTFPRR
jgi:hypothetical protein